LCSGDSVSGNLAAHAHVGGQLVHVKAKGRCSHIRLFGEVVGENNVLAGRAGDPGIIRNFLLQLAGTPAGATQGDEIMFRSFTTADVIQDIFGCGNADVLSDF